MNPKRLMTLLPAMLMLAAPAADACTNFIAARGATADGSVMTTYADDSYTRFGYLHHAPAGTHAPGEMRAVIDWGDDSPRGSIPQAPVTYNVVGNMNEHQVVIGETTWGGLPELVDTTANAILDYGSLIYITLERARSAAEAIDIIDDLTSRYGYASSGETFTIADKNEVWVLEITGRGPGDTGANWVAVRIPDNAVSAHANEARIRRVDYKDRKNVRYSRDLFKWACKHGYLTGKDEDFSFADAYGTHKPATRRTCDGRVWSFFRRFASPEQSAKWFQWVEARSDEPMPLYIVPDRKLTLGDMKAAMRDHYEGTPYDMTSDPGAGGHASPFRERPLRWEVDGRTYTNERPVATQQTAWHYVSQSRADLPDAAGGILWFGTDDASTSVYIPFRCSLTQVPVEMAVGNGDMYNFSDTSNFWVNNWVANQVYPRYDLMIDDVRRVQSRLEEGFVRDTYAMDAELAALQADGDTDGVARKVNDTAARMAGQATAAYADLARFLLVKYLDGARKKTDADGNLARNKHGKPLGPDSPGYRQDHYKRIVDATGDRFLLK